MEASSLLFIVGAVAVAVVTPAITRRWYRRQLLALVARLDKSERARQYALQQGMQARKQVEKLQRELSESRRPVVASPRAPAARQTPPVAAAAAKKAEEPAARPAPARPPNGFADTMPM
jgi:hypothetical protein